MNTKIRTESRKYATKILERKELSGQENRIGNLMIMAVGGGGYNMATAIRRDTTVDNIKKAKYVFADQTVGDSDSPSAEHILTEDDGSIRLSLLNLDIVHDLPADFFQDIDTVFIVAAMGGNTGTIWVPFLGKFAKSKGIKRVIALVTEPFRFEGEKKIIKALDGINDIKRSEIDDCLLISSTSLISCCEHINFFNAFTYVDKAVLALMEDLSTESKMFFGADGISEAERPESDTSGI